MIKLNKTLVILCTCFLTLISLTKFTYADGASFGIITGSNVNLRNNAGLSSKVIGTLQNDNLLQILGQNGDWYNVSTSNGSIGWVFKDYIKPTNLAGTINGSNVNFRESATLSSNVIERLQKGDAISILTQNGDWYNVSTSDGKTGWIYKSYVSIGSNDRVETSRGSSRDTTAQSIVDYAKLFLNVRYVWGGNTPDQGFDCSGYVKYVYQRFGINLQRVAADQAQEGTLVSKENLEPGDLIFFDTDGGHNYINHVGIYIGNGMFIHASSAQHKVMISDLSTGFYASSFMTARRFF